MQFNLTADHQRGKKNPGQSSGAAVQRDRVIFIHPSVFIASGSRRGPILPPRTRAQPLLHGEPEALGHTGSFNSSSVRWVGSRIFSWLRVQRISPEGGLVCVEGQLCVYRRCLSKLGSTQSLEVLQGLYPETMSDPIR